MAPDEATKLFGHPYYYMMCQILPCCGVEIVEVLDVWGSLSPIESLVRVFASEEFENCRFHSPHHLHSFATPPQFLLNHIESKASGFYIAVF